MHNMIEIKYSNTIFIYNRGTDKFIIRIRNKCIIIILMAIRRIWLEKIIFYLKSELTFELFLNEI